MYDVINVKLGVAWWHGVLLIQKGRDFNSMQSQNIFFLSIYSMFCFKNLERWLNYDSRPRPAGIGRKSLSAALQKLYAQFALEISSFCARNFWISNFVWIISNEKSPRYPRFRGNRFFRGPPVKNCNREKKPWCWLTMPHHRSHEI
jgi:hypothetical protein